jgi:Spy/CpxP family protein refolding chaperone
MKKKMILTFLLSIVTASQSAFPAVQGKPTAHEPPPGTVTRASADNAQVRAALLATTPVIPRGPGVLLRDHEREMAFYAAPLSMNQRTISNPAGRGQMATQPGESVSGEAFPVRTDPAPSPAGETLLVAMPFSSLQLSPSLVEYLGLSPTQVGSIQRLMDQERPTTEPLMQELRTISGELGAVLQQSQNDENEGTAQRLAASQARLLKQLMRANSRLQARIDDVLDSQQRKKLDSFKRASEATGGEGN